MRRDAREPRRVQKPPDASQKAAYHLIRQVSQGLGVEWL
jgi:hypothetical protein